MNLQSVTVGELRERIVKTVITQPAPWTDDVGPYLDLQPNHSSERRAHQGAPCSAMGLDNMILAKMIWSAINPRKSERPWRTRIAIDVGCRNRRSRLSTR